MPKKFSSTRRLDPKLGMTRRKDPHKPKNKHKARDYKKYNGQGK